MLFGFLLLFTQMMPAAMIVVPMLQLYRNLHWTDNLPALSLIYAAFAIPLGAWILKSSYDNVPVDVLDAALVDGCTPLGVLRRILLPLSRPGLVAVAVIAFFLSWNDYIFASALITDRSKYTAGLGIATFLTQQDVPIRQLQAAGVIFSLLPGDLLPVPAALCRPRADRGCGEGVTDLAAPLIDLRGAHLVITGGGTGIGAAVALGAAAGGADVLVVGRRTEPLEEVVAQSKGSAGRDLGVVRRRGRARDRSSRRRPLCRPLAR